MLCYLNFKLRLSISFRNLNVKRESADNAFVSNTLKSLMITLPGEMND